MSDNTRFGPLPPPPPRSDDAPPQPTPPPSPTQAPPHVDDGTPGGPGDGPGDGPGAHHTNPAEGLRPDPYVYSQPSAVPEVPHTSLRATAGGAPPPAIEVPQQSYLWNFRPVPEGGGAGPATAVPPLSPGEVATGYQPVAPIPLAASVAPADDPRLERTRTELRRLQTSNVVLWCVTLAEAAAIVWLAVR